MSQIDDNNPLSSMRDRTYRNGNGDHGRSKSSGEIEREVEDTRDRVRETLGELREKMSPGQMVDQVFDLARNSGGGDFTRNLGRTIRDNPVPVMLIGAGIAWLMMGRGSSSTGVASSSGTSSRVGYVADRESWPEPGTEAGRHFGAEQARMGRMGSGGGGSTMSDVKGAARDAYESATGAASSVAGSARSAADAVTGAARSMRDGASDMAAAVGDTASRFAHRAGSAYDRAGHMAEDLVQGGRHAIDRLQRGAGDVGHNVRRVAEEQPLIIGAVGLAVGAALGAALPRTRTEDRWLGPVADQMRDQARTMASEKLDEAHEMAREAASTMAERVEETVSSLAQDASAAVGMKSDDDQKPGVLTAAHPERADKTATPPSQGATATPSATGTPASRPAVGASGTGGTGPGRV